MSERPQPTGRIRPVGVNDMFFSVTDHRGVITGFNSVFSRLAQLSRDKLINSPHNIVRHPEMPGGTFYAMWDALLAGRPFAAYVRNLASDGAAYDVFATTVPVGDGFLSVRTAQMIAPRRDAAYGVYAGVLPVEAEARREGASRSEAAVAGFNEIVRRLGTAGFNSYDEFMYAALPAEVLALTSAVGTGAAGAPPSTPTGQVLRATFELIDALGDIIGRIDGLQSLVDELGTVSQGVLSGVDALRDVARNSFEASQTVHDVAPVLTSTAKGMASVSEEAVAILAPLGQTLADVRLSVMGTRFRIAMARLQAEMVVRFAREVLGGEATSEGLGYVPILCAVLDSGVRDATTGLTWACEELDATRADIERAVADLERFQWFLSTLRIQVPRYGVSRQLAGYVGPLDAQLHEGMDLLVALRVLIDRCRQEARPFEAGRLAEIVERIRFHAEQSVAAQAGDFGSLRGVGPA